MSVVPNFPPLMKGLAAGPANPFAIACDQARRGVDSGLVPWSIGEERLRAALVLAPETPLEEAMAALPACAVGLQNAIGTLAPAETAVHLEWQGGIRLNGGHVGALSVAASTPDRKDTPDWLVVGLDLTLSLPADFEPGETPDWTALKEEGCGEIDPAMLLEAWARHSLFWLSGLEESGGRARLHREFEGLSWRRGEAVSIVLSGSRHDGTFLGVDENFGMLLKSDTTRLLPMSQLLTED